MSNSHQIGLAIRACRESRGISQDYMADMLDIAQSAYANLESGKTNMSIDRLIRITEILELDIHTVIEESIFARDRLEGPPHPHSRKLISSETKEVYDQLIMELKSEVEFLKEIVNRSI